WRLEAATVATAASTVVASEEGRRHYWLMLTLLLLVVLDLAIVEELERSGGRTREQWMRATSVPLLAEFLALTTGAASAFPILIHCLKKKGLLQMTTNLIS
ncbi:hypothetical protein PIB30_105214, partial [Stylosanthes scabra]|nr:hypothetical protein [Stylosanthes scabra]